MGVFPVSEAKEKALKDRMASLGIREEDLQESFIRSSGPGGQKVNKTATRVQLRHVPTGVEVKCSKARTQGMNRYHARAILADKIETLIKGRESEEKKRIAKLRRQKRRRSKRAKEKILAAKRKVSEKKRLRRPVAEGEE